MKAEVFIRAALREGRPSLRENYFTPPFKVMNITEDKEGGFLELMLMCSSPGVLDGDDYRFRLDIGEGCGVRLHTQSYQRLFQMKNSAVQSMEVQLGREASFVYMPHPSVPHRASVFTARNKIYLVEGSRLIWGEILTCGRKLNGEVFTYSKYHSMTDIFVGERLLIRENLCLQPLQQDVQAMGQMEGYTHQASLLLIGFGPGASGSAGTGAGVLPGPGGGGKMVDRVREYLAAQEGVLGGVSQGPGDSLIVRMLGYKGEQLHAVLKSVAAMVGEGG